MCYGRLLIVWEKYGENMKREVSWPFNIYFLALPCRKRLEIMTEAEK